MPSADMEYCGRFFRKEPCDRVCGRAPLAGDSEYTNPAYQGINEEYMQAHKHFRGRDYKDCIVNCAKAFESTMKIICDTKGYPYDKGKAGAADLLNVLFTHSFIPSYLQGNLTGLKKMLGEGGYPLFVTKRADMAPELRALM
jgi:hypothetical protein